MFTFTPHIVAYFPRYMIWTYFSWKSGKQTEIIFLKLCCPRPTDIVNNSAMFKKKMTFIIIGLQYIWIRNFFGEPPSKTLKNLKYQNRDVCIKLQLKILKFVEMTDIFEKTKKLRFLLLKILISRPFSIPKISFDLCQSDIVLYL